MKKPSPTPIDLRRWNRLTDQIEGPLKTLRNDMKKKGYRLEVSTRADGSIFFESVASRKV